jgi:2-amino-4-hydroxy-6-hydroxymethyldihydropteridine diphosphokinase
LELVRAYIGLGANVGDARATLTDAVAALGALPGAHRAGVSPLYRTAPVGVLDQPDFLNAVVALDVPAGTAPAETADPAAGAIDLLVALKRLEGQFGRQKRGRWEPRELDLDLLLYGDHALALERPPEAVPASAAIDPGAAARLLEVPHPAMGERLFVLAPLADLAADLVPPGWDETVEAARQRQAGIEGVDAVAVVGAWSDVEAAWIGPSGGPSGGRSGGPISVDRATPDDVDGMARAHTAASDAAYGGLVRPEPDPIGRRARMWRGVLANPAHGAFVARDGGRIVGLVSVGPLGEAPSVGAVHTLYVMEPWWGSGAGQALLDRAHAELAGDYDEAQLTVLADNVRARRFYERNGWVEGETLIEPHFGDRPTRVTRYRRRLR